MQSLEDRVAPSRLVKHTSWLAPQQGRSAAASPRPRSPPAPGPVTRVARGAIYPDLSGRRGGLGRSPPGCAAADSGASPRAFCWRSRWSSATEARASWPWASSLRSSRCHSQGSPPPRRLMRDP